MYTIRPYAPKDRARVEAICLSPENPDFGAKSGRGGLMQKATLAVFCRYYIECEPGNCFVAANADDEAMGYILCAADFGKWEETFTRQYLKKSLNPITKAMGKATVDILRPFCEKYPAHLHIDLAASCQRQGLGTRLMDTLLAHLQASGVPGVALSVEANNEKGIRFYQKYGFQELARDEREITMGKILPACL